MLRRPVSKGREMWEVPGKGVRVGEQSSQKNWKASSWVAVWSSGLQFLRWLLLSFVGRREVRLIMPPNGWSLLLLVAGKGWGSAGSTGRGPCRSGEGKLPEEGGSWQKG